MAGWCQSGHPDHTQYLEKYKDLRESSPRVPSIGMLDWLKCHSHNLILDITKIIVQNVLKITILTTPTPITDYHPLHHFCGMSLVK